MADQTNSKDDMTTPFSKTKNSACLCITAWITSVIFTYVNVDVLKATYPDQKCWLFTPSHFLVYSAEWHRNISTFANTRKLNFYGCIYLYQSSSNMSTLCSLSFNWTSPSSSCSFHLSQYMPCSSLSLTIKMQLLSLVFPHPYPLFISSESKQTQFKLHISPVREQS